MSQASSRDILTQALEAKGVSKQGIANEITLALARRLVTLHQATADDPLVACFFSEGGKQCTVNMPLSIWEKIKASVDPGATNGAPVPAHQQQWV
jgi:hypothetical protein